MLLDQHCTLSVLVFLLTLGPHIMDPCDLCGLIHVWPFWAHIGLCGAHVRP